MSMTSSRPYMVRALYEWIVENSCTPYVLVNALAESVLVPQDHVKDGQIVLNIAPSAVKDLFITNQLMTFNAKFGGVPTDIQVPVGAIMGIYARENGQGMVFEYEEPEPTPPPDDNIKTLQSKPSLKVVK